VNGKNNLRSNRMRIRSLEQRFSSYSIATSFQDKIVGLGVPTSQLCMTCDNIARFGSVGSVYDVLLLFHVAVEYEHVTMSAPSLGAKAKGLLTVSCQRMTSMT
jgi:hypothetical protein